MSQPPQFKHRERARPGEWARDAACEGRTSAMYPEDGAGVLRAKEICAGCPVRGECLGHALVNREDNGVWGGKSERERRILLRAMKRGAA